MSWPNRDVVLEQAVARWYPDVQTIAARTGASLHEIRAVMDHLEAVNAEDTKPKLPPIPMPRQALLAAHAAYVRGDRTPAVLAGQRLYDAARKRRKYHHRSVDEIGADRVLVDAAFYAPMVERWRERLRAAANA